MKRLSKLFSNIGSLLCPSTLAVVMGSALATSVAAQNWTALVIGQSGPSTPLAFADAFHVDAALSHGGVANVRMLRDRPIVDVQVALDGLAGHQRALIYVSAPLLQKGDGIALKGGTLGFDALLARAKAAGVAEVALLVESCPSPDSTLALPASEADMKLLVAAAAAPGEACPIDGARLSAALQDLPDTPTPLDEILKDVWVSSDLDTMPILRPKAQRQSPVMAVAAAPVAARVETIVSQSNVSLLSPVTIAPTRQSTRQSATASPSAFAPTGSSVLPAALAVAEGLPQPSIIVGVVSGVTPASFSPAPETGDLTGQEISFDNLQARRAMRAQDPALFGALVEGGAFDPPQDILAAALQTELARMACYEGAIDGLWGRGSRASVERYFDQLEGATPVTLDPVVDLFRQVILVDDVVCPAVARAAAQPAATTRARTTTTRRTTRQAAPQRQQNTTRTISNSNRLGVFR